MHQNKGGFDHAAVHDKSDTLYVAHTANDAVDVIDSHHDKYLRSIQGLPGVAGVLVSNEKGLVFTSNRGEKTVGVFPHDQEKKLAKVRVGGFPNGLAFDPSSDHLLAANVSRWTVFDEQSHHFYVNISKPSQIVAVDSKDPDGIAASYDIPATGPHGLDIDLEARRLFCACDQGGLFTVDLESRRVSHVSDLSGPPDVIFYNSRLHHLYVAIGDPGMIDVFDTDTMKLSQTVKTEVGAHTIAYNPEIGRVYAFLPASHRAAIYQEV